MSASGFSLLGRLVSKHVSNLGDVAAAKLAEYDPETAVEVDREQLAQHVHDTAAKYVLAKNSFDQKNADLTALQTQVAQDTASLTKLEERVKAGTVSQDAAGKFCDELEASQAKVKQLQDAAAAAKEYMDEIKQVLDHLQDMMASSEQRADKALQSLATAREAQQLEQLKAQQREDVKNLQGLGGSPSSAVSALEKKAAQVKADTEASRMVGDIADKPLRDKQQVNDLRASLAGTAAPTDLASRMAALRGAANPA